LARPVGAHPRRWAFVRRRAEEDLSEEDLSEDHLSEERSEDLSGVLSMDLSGTLSMPPPSSSPSPSCRGGSSTV
ncbi:hypothetical protein, partial [Streptomyces sp. NPDC050804]|uniref:hypothetical protein n=1 Tax=Streptomyces sp. NPDC050804 TaxID=3154745 RepID=UPI003446F4BF